MAASQKDAAAIVLKLHSGVLLDQVADVDLGLIRRSRQMKNEKVSGTERSRNRKS